MVGQAIVPSIEANSASYAEHSWLRVQTMPDRYRIAVKQQAVDDGLKYAEDILGEISKRQGDKKPQDLVGAPIFKLLAETDELRRKLRECKVIVGVRGATGAGKTSLLNSLLGVSVLPVGCSGRASTATVCHISWNHDDDPENAFKAGVYFRSTDDVAQELATILDAIRERKRIREDPQCDLEMMHELDTTVNEGMGLWKEIWSLDESKIENQMELSVQTIMERSPAAFRLLGQTLNFNSAVGNIFAEKIKPYLDSSTTSDCLTVWPLVQEVKVYVKSSILQDGIELVDLPGASDTVAGRAKVAEKYASKVDVTIVVLPANRAVSERTGVDLMTEYQELDMKLAGKFHKGSFCVVISKIDGDFYIDSFISDTPEAKKDPGFGEIRAEVKELMSRLRETKRSLQDALKEEKKDRKELENDDKNLVKINAEAQKIKGLPAGEGKKKRQEALRKKRTTYKKEHKQHMANLETSSKSVRSYEKQETNIKVKIATMDGRKVYRGIWLRNEHIKESIARNLFTRQQGTISTTGRQDSTINIIPVCSTAYQDCLKRRLRPGAIFPSDLHTGVPKLQQWIEETSYQEREKNLDALLASLHRIHRDISHWCSEEVGGKVQFPREDVNKIIQGSTLRHQEHIRDLFTHLGTNIQNLVNFGEKESKYIDFNNIGLRASLRWVHKYPDEPQLTVRMSAMTYLAITRREGGPYISKSEDTSYDWPKKLCSAFLGTLIKDWVKVFDSKIPHVAQHFYNQITEAWGKYLHEIQKHLFETAPDLQVPFMKIYGALDEIAPEFCDRVRKVIDSIKKSSRSTRSVYSDSVRTQLCPIFRHAVKITGTGSFKNRQIHITNAISKDSPIIHTTAWEAMTKARRERVIELLDELPKICADMFKAAEIKLTILLDKLDASCQIDQWNTDESAQVRRNVKSLVMQWGASWVTTTVSPELKLPKDVGIPEEYYENWTQFENESDEEDVKSEEEEDSDVKMASSDEGEG